MPALQVGCRRAKDFAIPAQRACPTRPVACHEFAQSLLEAVDVVVGRFQWRGTLPSQRFQAVNERIEVKNKLKMNIARTSNGY